MKDILKIICLDGNGKLTLKDGTIKKGLFKDHKFLK